MCLLSNVHIVSSNDYCSLGQIHQATDRWGGHTGVWQFVKNVSLRPGRDSYFR